MTEQEALNALKKIEDDFQIAGKARMIAEFFEGLSIAEKALEKHIPQKVIDVTDYWGEDELEYSEKGCPKCNYHDCGLESSNDVEFNYCPMCGQRLDWSKDGE